tara:strand:+ start:5511 stop:5888 length:378 start_codon:yes stop_codon:yes gene_type:complete
VQPGEGYKNTIGLPNEGRELLCPQYLIYKQMKNQTKIIAYQLDSKNNLQPRVSAGTMGEALQGLYDGLVKNERIGKKFFKIGKTQPIKFNHMKGSRYLQINNVRPNTYSVKQAIMAFNELEKSIK